MHDCPWWNERPRKYEPRCGARLVDLDHNILPRDLPPEPVHRQRQPAREDVSAPRPSRPRDQPYRPPMLSHWPDDCDVVVVCKRCGRREAVDKGRLLASGDVPLVDLRMTMVADCPRQRASMDRDRCSPSFEGWPP